MGRRGSAPAQEEVGTGIGVGIGNGIQGERGDRAVLDRIAKTRDGLALDREEIYDLVEGAVDGRYPDYQLSAWLMAVYLRGLSDREVFDLTEAMATVGSGETEAPLGEVDKHSTGGVGDKTTLAIGPLTASLGVRVAKMSGRGLGHTGGTLDKLESIPGFRVERSRREIEEQVARIGLAVVAQSGELAPADRRLYALRDVTATVDSIPLIASSIMAKKLVGGAPNLVLDVKVGSGAFMPTLERAKVLTELMIRIGTHHHRKVRALLTNMDQPLGHAVGNALEVNEAALCLRGEGPPDLREEVLALSAHMVALARDLPTDVAHSEAQRALDTGRAWDTFRNWIESQGGDVAAVERGLPTAPVIREDVAEQAGSVAHIDALSVGHAVLELGAGRMRLGDPVDPGVGAEVFVKVGDRVVAGQVRFRVYARSETAAQAAVARIREAIRMTDGPCERPAAILTILGDGGPPLATGS